MNVNVGRQWVKRMSLSFELGLHEDSKEEPRAELTTSEKEERKLVAEGKLFSVLEIKWDLALLIRNLHVIGPRMNVLKYFIQEMKRN